MATCHYTFLAAILSAARGHAIATNVVYIRNPAVFSSNGQRLEIHVARAGPTACSDRSGIVRNWTVGHGQHNSIVRTYTLTCASSMPNAPPRQPHHATVCHPVTGHKGNRPARWAVEKWVQHYLNHGFNHVFFYVYDAAAAEDGIKNTTWFVAPWLEHMHMHEGGQEAAVQHCLHWNRRHNNTWTLYADLDEYMVATQASAQPGTDLVRMATHGVGDPRHLAGVDFGEYRITDFMRRLDGTNDDPMATRIRFNKSATRRGAQLGSRGHRKPLVQNVHIKSCNIHHCLPDNGSGVIYHHPLRNFALLHVRNLLRFVPL